MTFEAAAAAVEGVPIMPRPEGRRIYDHIRETRPDQILELGTAHGVSAVYMAAALEANGKGSVTTVDFEGADYRDPTPEELVERAGLAHRVEIVRRYSSYTWFLKEKIEERSEADGRCEPLYDFCFLDGCKNWTIDGLAVLLVEKLLLPGGWLLMDDLAWSYGDQGSQGGRESCDGITNRSLSTEELAEPHLKAVFELIVKQHPSFGNFRVENDWWGWAQKREAPGVARRRSLKTATEPLTSVMMPAYDAEATIRESVESALAQSEPNLELIVVDDASAVPLTEVLADISDQRLRIIRHRRNRGPAAARNTALAAARAPLVSQLDADDLWEPDYLESVLPELADPAVGLVYTNATILGHPTGHDTYIVDPSPHPIDRFPKLAEQNPVPALTATMRRPAVASVGGYARWLWLAQDYHLYLKLAAAGWRFVYVDRKLARFRWPEPTRGRTYDRRRHERYELAMYAGFAARHPLTPGPRHQVRTRVRREFDRMLRR
jgi:predicted O-methyltransferase YrrM